LSFATLAFASQLKSEENHTELFHLSLEELLAIKVSVASNVITNIRKQPASVSTITKYQIQLSGARTLSELLGIFIPGYFMVEDQDDTIAGFRGLVPDNNSKVMLLLNGENLNTEWFWGPPDAILNGIDLGYIERIEVIRGPGSVTLGQGALLGVINIITTSGTNNKVSLKYSRGSDSYTKSTASLQFNDQDFKAWLYLSKGDYQGHKIANKGWAAAHIDQGLSVFERNHHLHRSDFNNYLGSISYKQLDTNIFHFEQRRDLYNFFRDREVVEQRLTGINFKYKDKLSETINMTLSAKYLSDEYSLFTHGNNTESLNRLNYETNDSPFAQIINSIDGLADSRVEPGLVMGGTRETRHGLKAIFNYESKFAHKFAFGFEYNHFKSGQKDQRGNNFIVNDEVQLLGLSSDGAGGITIAGAVNDNNTWVNPTSYSIKSVFLEDNWAFNQSTNIFAAVRLDDHPNWGSHTSPRIGFSYDFNIHHLVRVSFQSGFRGAVGVQFSGGFVQDGFLAEENFNVVNSLVETNADFDFDGIAGNDSAELKPVSPETIDSFEIAYSYHYQSLKLDSVLFLNTVEDILTAQAHGYTGIGFGDKIGSDYIGTWNGNWYYQNQDGQLKQNGLELELEYKANQWSFSASHSLVKVIKADPGTIGIYVLEDKKTAAYPENVTRFHASYFSETSLGEFKLNLNDLYYWDYYAPTGLKVNGSHIFNGGLSFIPKANPNLRLNLIFKNLFNSNDLYPINGTGDLAGADGTPSIEQRGWWLDFQYNFD